MTSHRPYSFSHTGRRKHNEDRVLAKTGSWRNQPVSLIAVADGMGGHACGEVASEIAARSLETWWQQLLQRKDLNEAQGVRASLLETYARINERIREYGQQKPEAAGLGTTLVVVLVVGQRALVANVGDSRAYRLKQDLIEQLSLDHSAMADALRA